MLWMYIWMHPYHVTTSLINQALRFYWESWKMLGNKLQHYAVVEALDSFKKAPIWISIIFKVVDNLYMLWMCLWMRPYHVTASLIGQAFRMLLPIPGNPGQQTTVLCSMQWLRLWTHSLWHPLQCQTYVRCLTKPAYAVDVHMCASSQEQQIDLAN